MTSKTCALPHGIAFPSPIKIDFILFIESSRHQALGITKQSRKPVLGIERQAIVPPETVK